MTRGREANAGARRRNMAHTYLPDSEKRAVADRAARVNLTVSAFLRRPALGAPLVEPDFVRSRGMAIERKAQGSQPLDDPPVIEAGEASHSRSGDHERILQGIADLRQNGRAAPGSRLHQLSGDVAGDLQRLDHRPALRHQAGNVIGRRELYALRQFLDVQVNDLFHRPDPVRRPRAPFPPYYTASPKISPGALPVR